MSEAGNPVEQKTKWTRRCATIDLKSPKRKNKRAMRSTSEHTKVDGSFKYLRAVVYGVCSCHNLSRSYYTVFE